MNSTVFVYTLSRTGEVGAWSRYTFPFSVDNFAQDGEKLYIRSGDDVLMVDPTATADYVGSPTQISTFNSTIQWQWLDYGQPGVSKLMVGFDLVAASNILATVSVGYDQSNKAAFTPFFTIPADTVPGTFIPLSLFAPSFSLKITFAGSAQWTLYSVTTYLRDSRPTA